MPSFQTPQELADYQVRHVDRDEDEDRRAVGDSKCRWCGCKIRKFYHEEGCPVRELVTAKMKKEGRWP